jgi:hypothetical protein
MMNASVAHDVLEEILSKTLQYENQIRVVDEKLMIAARMKTQLQEKCNSCNFQCGKI